MLSKPHRWRTWDTWSRYLRFPTCPRCATDVVEATVRREKGRLRRIAAFSIVVGVMISILSELFGLLWG